MKKWAFFLFSILLISTTNVNAQSKYEELELRGPVRSITITYSYSDGNEGIESFFFSENHFLVENRSFQKRTNSNYIKTYDSLERLISIREKDASESFQVHKYNDDRKSFQEYYKGVLIAVGKLNEKGKIIERVARLGAGLIAVRPEDNSQPKYIITSTYDQNGNLIRIVSTFITDGKETLTQIFAEISYDDKQQRIFKRELSLDGSNHTETSQIYDDRGFLLERKFSILATSSLIIATFTYDQIDEHGNWTKRREFHDGFEYRTETRTIEYYN